MSTPETSSTGHTSGRGRAGERRTALGTAASADAEAQRWILESPHPLATGRHSDPPSPAAPIAAPVLPSPEEGSLLRHPTGEPKQLLAVFQDIADRKRAEHLLQESEATTSAMLNAIPESVLLLTPEGLCDAVNATAARRLGKRPEEIVGNNVLDLLPPALAAQRKACFQESAATGKSVYSEDERQGMVFDHQVHPVFDAEGRVSRLVIFARDITLQRQAERALRNANDQLEMRVAERTAKLAEANQELREVLAASEQVAETLRREIAFRTAIVARATQGLCVGREICGDPFAAFTVWNDRMREITGYALEEINCRNGHRALFPDPAAARRWAARVQRIRQGDHLLKEEWVITRADGERRTVLISTTALDSGNGRKNFLAIMQDITERKRDLEELRNKERTVTALLNSSTEAISLLDCQGTVLAANEAKLRQVGLTEGQYCGKNAFDFMPPDVAQFRKQRMAEVLRSGQPCRFESTWAGTIQDTNLFPIANETGEVVGVASFARDITKEKLAEAALLQSEKSRAEAEKLAATGRMAARIAHEINNPLAGIRNAFLLFKDAVPKDCPEYGFVERTEKEIDRLARIVRLMYDLHRPNQEREADVRIDETLAEVTLMLEPLRQRHGVRVERDGALPMVRAHIPEGALRQVLFSLLTNAIEASPPGGVVRLGMVVERQELIVSIADQGSGIPQELQTRIFEPFFSTKTGKGAEGGLGLGLSTARQLTENLGGTLGFESQSGNGTVFRLHLPLARIKGVQL